MRDRSERPFSAVGENYPIIVSRRVRVVITPKGFRAVKRRKT